VTSRFTRLFPHAVTAAAAAVVVLILLVPGAIADGTSVPAPPAQPTSADQIQNIDQVKTAIKAYYGDTLTQTFDPVNGTVQLHTFSPSGAYANEMAGVEADAAKYLDKAAKHDQKFSGTPAVLFDIDDTTLNTYSYEIYSNFVFNPTTNAAFVNNAVFPATPGMPALVSHARDDGYTVFFLTGRPEAQRPGTVTNLQNAGYGTEDKDHLFLKDLTAPWLSSCAPSCSTTQYKSLTRQHIESLGYDIVANFGDQFSDLNGGFADQTFKIPNPMYFLP
jgi:HAD superfamily, subfamily IIIB (Acid phosphatase)